MLRVGEGQHRLDDKLAVVQSIRRVRGVFRGKWVLDPGGAAKNGLRTLGLEVLEMVNQVTNRIGDGIALTTEKQGENRLDPVKLFQKFRLIRCLLGKMD